MNMLKQKLIQALWISTVLLLIGQPAVPVPDLQETTIRNVTEEKVRYTIKKVDSTEKPKKRVLEVGDIDGSLGNFGAQIEYQFTKIFGLGLGYDYFRIDVTYDDSELRSDLEYQYHGIQAYGILRF